MTSLMNSLLERLHLSSGPKEPPVQAPSEDEISQLRDKYAKAKQDHVFKFYDNLSNAEKAAIYQRLANIDPEHINELAHKVLHPPESKNAGKPTLDQLPSSATASIFDSSEEDLKRWYNEGLALIAEDKVAVVLMAGGQGTRLGSVAPKGCFDIGLPSHKSLFQLQAERILKIQQLAAKAHDKQDVVVPWYVMTSEPTVEPTQKFFQEHKYFGLETDNVFIFEQGVLPCLSNDGKILLESKSEVAVAPDGNGGLYQALSLSGALSDMRKRGIEHIHAYSVDNSLAKVADPTFIGFASSKSADIATKVVRKRDAKEPVGLILQKNGKPDVVEYSEIDAETAETRDPRNHERLKFRAANIVNHYYSFGFLESVPEWAYKLPHHVAKKKIPCLDIETGEHVEPDKPNGIKLEQFVFDCFPFIEMEKFACLEVKREDEFSPLKNGTGSGEDNAKTCRKHIVDQGKRWVEEAGAIVVSEGEDTGVEVSPFISYGGEGLAFVKERTIKAPAVIEREA